MQWLYASYNLLQASAMAGLVAELTVRRWSGLAHSWDEVGISTSLGQAAHVCAWLLLSIAWQSVVEYIWHVTLHLEPLYSWAHRIHHFPRSPEPFDDLLIHPLESLGYNFILFSPSMFPQHWVAFLAYMGILGICGVLDHSGVRAVLAIPMPFAIAPPEDMPLPVRHAGIGSESDSQANVGSATARRSGDEDGEGEGEGEGMKRKGQGQGQGQSAGSARLRNSESKSGPSLRGWRWGTTWITLYDAREHDLHHEMVNVNFGFPTMLLDHAFGTYAPPESRYATRNQESQAYEGPVHPDSGRKSEAASESKTEPELGSSSGTRTRTETRVDCRDGEWKLKSGDSGDWDDVGAGLDLDPQVARCRSGPRLQERARRKAVS